MEYLKEDLEIYIDKKNKIAGIMSQNAEIAWADSMLNFEAQKVEMKRLVLCWNACRHITNEALEIGVVAEGIESMFRKGVKECEIEDCNYLGVRVFEQEKTDVLY